MQVEADMVPKENGFNQSETPSCSCARTLWRFPGSPAIAGDSAVLQISGRAIFTFPTVVVWGPR